MKDLEFLPAHHIRARQNQRLRLTRMWLLMVLTLSMVCWAVYSRTRIAFVEGQLELQESEDTVTAIDYQRQLGLLKHLGEQQALYQAQKGLVADLIGGGRRGELLIAIAECIPEQVVLTRLEIERQEREVKDRLGIPAPALRRRGAAPKAKTETVDRVRIEGFAANDLALARFLQNVNEGRRFGQGELGFSKDATFRDRSVRVFAATFFAPVRKADSLASGALAAGGGR